MNSLRAQPNPCRAVAWGLLGSGLLSLLGGCGKSTVAEAPLPLGEVPAAVQSAVQQSPEEVRAIAGEVITAMEGREESAAFLNLAELSERPELTPEQRRAVARSLAALQEQVQAAAAKGDKKAEQALEQYRATK
jgi:hypothetical protein